MANLMQLKLAFLREFQNNYPKSHVGGSIGLMLYGFDLKRDLNLSDLDIVSDVYYKFESNYVNNEIIESSFVEDFATRFIVHHAHSSLFTKVEIRVDTNDKFDRIDYHGFAYNVSKIEDILKWKTKYANKGYSKHRTDLYMIANSKNMTGINLDQFCEKYKYKTYGEPNLITSYDGDEIEF